MLQETSTLLHIWHILPLQESKTTVKPRTEQQIFETELIAFCGIILPPLLVAAFCRILFLVLLLGLLAAGLDTTIGPNTGLLGGHLQGGCGLGFVVWGSIRNLRNPAPCSSDRHRRDRKG